MFQHMTAAVVGNIHLLMLPIIHQGQHYYLDKIDIIGIGRKLKVGMQELVTESDLFTN